MALATREANLNISRLCRDAVEQALHAARQKAWFAALDDREPIHVPPEGVLAAVRAAKDEIEGVAIGDEL